MPEGKGVNDATMWAFKNVLRLHRYALSDAIEEVKGVVTTERERVWKGVAGAGKSRPPTEEDDEKTWYWIEYNHPAVERLVGVLDALDVVIDDS